MTENSLEKEVVTTEELTTEVEYDGEKYVVPATIRLWPLDVIEAQEAGHSLAMIKALLGDAQFAIFKANKGHDGKQRTFGQFTDLSDLLIQKALGSGK
jgi:hypothetical protein